MNASQASVPDAEVDRLIVALAQSLREMAQDKERGTMALNEAHARAIAALAQLIAARRGRGLSDNV
jgi:urease gamma subunit